jgi:RNA polymerase primary sigma factor
MVTAEEEVELSLRIHNGDEKALKKLVEANLRFVISVAKQYQNQGLSFPDLINEGNLGLVKAAGKFDETRGFKFISYAVWWIRQSIMQAISEQTRVVRLPLNRVSAINKIKKATPYLEQQLERDPTDSELAEHLDLHENLITENNKFKHRQVSFDKPLFHDDDVSLYDVIGTDGVSSPDNRLLKESIKTDILRAMNKLNKREFDIISMSFGINNTEVYNLPEIAEILEISSERVRQIRNSGLVKIKKILSGSKFFIN